MRYYITNFANLRKLTPSCIPISTCASDPKFFHNKENKWCNNQGYYIDSNGIFLGIREELLSPLNIPKEDCPCEKNCKFRVDNPNCPFLINYTNYLKTVDFDYLLSEFNRVAEDVRKITNYKGEASIVLLVYESESNSCSERQPLKDLFAKHNIELKDYRPELIGAQVVDDELPF